MSGRRQPGRDSDRNLSEWFSLIQQGRVKLPRIQRDESWDKERIRGFLNAVIDNLPAGIILVSEEAEQEAGETRRISTAGPKGPESRATEHLLDGRQRLTAFWRAVRDDYESEQYFIYVPELDRKNPGRTGDPEVHCAPRRRDQEGKQRPAWTGDPARRLHGGLFPIDLLCPGDKSFDILAWVEEATQDLEPGENDAEGKWAAYMSIHVGLMRVIDELRVRVAEFNLPYSCLPAGARKEAAPRAVGVPQ